MDPNEVVSQIAIDPNTGDPDTGKEPVYMIITTYRDGHTVSQRYKRGTGNPATGVPDQPDGGPMPGENKTVAAKWKTDMAAATPPGASPTQNRNGHIWGYNPATRQYDIDQGPAPAAVSAEDPSTAANNAALQQQRERNAALPPEQDPAYETDAERRARGRQTALDQEAAAARADAKAKADKAAADAEAAKSKPTISYKQINGQWFQVSTTPDGKETVTPSGLPKEVTPGTVITVDGQPATTVKDADGNITGVKILPVTGGTSKGEPPGAPPADYSPGNVNKSLQDYSAWVNQQVNDGTIDKATASKLVADRLALANSAIAEQGNTLRAATDVYGNQVSQGNNRASNATTGFSSILQAIVPIAKAQPKGSDAAVRFFHSMFDQQIAHQSAMGGAPVEVPAAVKPYLTITSPGGTRVDLHDNPGGTGAVPGAGGVPAIPGRPDVAPDPGAPAPGPADYSPSAEATAAPAGQLPAAIAAHADSKPTGNAFADTEMALTAGGIRPAAIEAARKLFLSGQFAPPLQEGVLA